MIILINCRFCTGEHCPAVYHSFHGVGCRFLGLNCSRSHGSFTAKMAVSCYISCYIKSKCLVKPLTQAKRTTLENLSANSETHEVVRFPLEAHRVSLFLCTQNPFIVPLGDSALLYSHFQITQKGANCHLKKASVWVCLSSVIDIMRLSYAKPSDLTLHAE